MDTTSETAATILHADLDAFYASVEQLLDPSLRGKPIAVGGGVVLAASYEAKRHGVSSGMPAGRARERCPELEFVGGHFAEYRRLGDQVMAILGDFTDLVHRISIDEALRFCVSGGVIVPESQVIERATRATQAAADPAADPTGSRPVKTG